MSDIRVRQESCLACGGKTPVAVTKHTDHDYLRYECPRCGTSIVHGIVSTDSTPAQCGTAYIPGNVRHSADVAEDVSWNTWEAWWTDVAFVVAIHGVPVAGNDELLTFAENLRNRHDDST